MFYQQLIDFSNLTTFQQNLLKRNIEAAFENGRITERRKDRLLDLLATAQNLSDEDAASLQRILDEGYEIRTFEDDKAFGIMNYAISVPLLLSSKNFSFMLSYTYSIPVALPGEFFEVDPVGFFGASVSYRIRLNN